jgi:hypothetical protein
MKNVITNQTRFTVKHTKFEDTTGMKKGFSTTRSLIKIYDGGVLINEITRSDFKVVVAVYVSDKENIGEVSDVKVCRNENGVKNTWFWGLRKKGSLTIINSES